MKQGLISRTCHITRLFVNPIVAVSVFSLYTLGVDLNEQTLTVYVTLNALENLEKEWTNQVMLMSSEMRKMNDVHWHKPRSDNLVTTLIRVE